MRFTWVILFILISGLLANAQETEKRIQSILHPDRNEASHFGGKTFYGGSLFQPKSGAANVKSYNYTERYSPQGFWTKSYTSSSSYSTGKFSSHQANTTSPYVMQGVGKKADTKTAPTKDAPGSDKSYTASTGYNTREFRDRGKSQDSLNLQKKDTKPMTIDQVREILDKNK